MSIQSDGKIAAVGYTDPFGNIINNFMVDRFNPDGTPDNTFALIGLNIVDFLGGDDNATSLALAPDGKIVEQDRRGGESGLQRR